jgi:ribonuclease HII
LGRFGRIFKKPLVQRKCRGTIFDSDHGRPQGRGNERAYYITIPAISWSPACANLKHMKIAVRKTTKKSPSHRHAAALIKAGYPLVAGIDEVGRGCWAGPVVAAAVILPPGIRKLAGVNDSKLLTHARRVQFARLIKRHALAVGIGWVSAQDIDDNGLTWAVRQSGLRALDHMRYPYDAVLLDGNHNYLKEHCYSETIIKGDQLSISIAAASIVAKVARDQFMELQHRLYPEYDFAANKGYGTPRHAEAVRVALTPLHRRLFKPVQLAADGFFESLDFSDVID